MASYMIIEIQVHDPSLYQRYVDAVPDIVGRYGGRYLARGGRVTSLSDEWQPERVILLEFDHQGAARRLLPFGRLRHDRTVARGVDTVSGHHRRGLPVLTGTPVRFGAGTAPNTARERLIPLHAGRVSQRRRTPVRRRKSKMAPLDTMIEPRAAHGGTTGCPG